MYAYFGRKRPGRFSHFWFQNTPLDCLNKKLSVCFSAFSLLHRVKS
jgi:hypothetical protein